MDLAVGARRVIVLMERWTKDGQDKLVRRCTYPLTAAGVVRRVITDEGVFDPAGDGFVEVDGPPR